MIQCLNGPSLWFCLACFRGNIGVHSQIVNKFPNLSEPQFSSSVKISRTNDTYLAWLSWDWVGRHVKNILSDLAYRTPKVLIASPSQTEKSPHVLCSVFPCQRGCVHERWMQLTSSLNSGGGWCPRDTLCPKANSFSCLEIVKWNMENPMSLTTIFSFPPGSALYSSVHGQGHFPWSAWIPI